MDAWKQFERERDFPTSSHVVTIALLTVWNVIIQLFLVVHVFQLITTTVLSVQGTQQKDSVNIQKL